MRKRRLLSTICMVLFVACSNKEANIDRFSDKSNMTSSITTSEEQAYNIPYYSILDSKTHEIENGYFAGMDYKQTPLLSPYFPDGEYIYVNHDSNVRVFHDACDIISEYNTFEQTFVKCEKLKDNYRKLPNVSISDLMILKNDTYHDYSYHGFFNGEWGYSSGPVKNNRGFHALLDAIVVLADMPSYIEFETTVNVQIFSYGYEASSKQYSVQISFLEKNMNYGYVSVHEKGNIDFSIEDAENYMAFLDPSLFRVELESFLNDNSDHLRFPSN